MIQTLTPSSELAKNLEDRVLRAITQSCLCEKVVEWCFWVAGRRPASVWSCDWLGLRLVLTSALSMLEPFNFFYLSNLILVIEKNCIALF